MKHHAAQMYDYHVWANRNVFARLREVPPELYTKEIQSVFPSIAATLAHIYSTDSIWLCVLSQMPMADIMAKAPQIRERTQGAELARMEELYADLEREYRTFFERHPDLDQPAKAEHPKFGILETTLGGIVQHVVNHGTYHRGQITAMLRQLGVPGASSDYVTYLYTLMK
jgi:uncharacterized damage-inducible protein DinB